MSLPHHGISKYCTGVLKLLTCSDPPSRFLQALYQTGLPRPRDLMLGSQASLDTSGGKSSATIAVPCILRSMESASEFQ